MRGATRLAGHSKRRCTHGGGLGLGVGAGSHVIKHRMWKFYDYKDGAKIWKNDVRSFSNSASFGRQE